MLKHVELDPSFRLQQQYADSTGRTAILVNLFDVDPKDQEYFTAAWRKDAEFFEAQPGYISAQLHQGVGGSRMFMNYAVFENTAAFAATNDQPEFGPLRDLPGQRHRPSAPLPSPLDPGRVRRRRQPPPPVSMIVLTPRPVALIAGASGGIGVPFSRRLADHDVVLVARNRERLETLRSELRDVHPAGRFEVVVADLSVGGGPQVVLDEVGTSTSRSCWSTTPAPATTDPWPSNHRRRCWPRGRWTCAAVVALARGVLPTMLARWRGAIVDVASTAAF
ncbi:MAG: antibiotic biosynthesis monooxygenase [Pseudonocardiales bacterium]|nr:antibiotic biosynthesis monooxygenase [Pseudonocardiales bacterium]